MVVKFIHRADPYEVVVTDHPEGKKYQVYGVKNQQTGVFEAFVSTLPVAIEMADSLQAMLMEGIRPKPSEEEAEKALMALLASEKRAKGRLS